MTTLSIPAYDLQTGDTFTHCEMPAEFVCWLSQPGPGLYATGLIWLNGLLTALEPAMYAIVSQNLFDNYEVERNPRSMTDKERQGFANVLKVYAREEFSTPHIYDTLRR